MLKVFKNQIVDEVHREVDEFEPPIGMEQFILDRNLSGIKCFSSPASGKNKVHGRNHHLLGDSDTVNDTVVAHSCSQIVNTSVMFDQFLDPGIDGKTTEQCSRSVCEFCEFRKSLRNL